MLYSGPRKTHGIFSFSESIAKQCFTAHFLNQYSVSQVEIRCQISILLSSILSFWGVFSHHSLLLTISIIISLYHITEPVHNQPYVVRICKVKWITLCNLMRHIIMWSSHNHHLKAHKNITRTPPNHYFHLLLPSKVYSGFILDILCLLN